MPARAFREWADFATREPFGAPAIDARIGFMLAVIVNALTGRKTRPADYTPKWTPESADLAPEDWRAMRRKFRSWKNAHHCQAKS